MDQISENLQYHLENRICVAESVFMPGSKAHIDLLSEARNLYLTCNTYIDRNTALLFEMTDLGLSGIYEGNLVPLDFPVEILDDVNEALYHNKKVKLGYPKRGGTKKFYVYVKGKSGNVIKVQFGDTTGKTVKIKDPERRRSFAARHQCHKKKDKTKPGYWACRINRYAHIWGGKTYPGFW